MKKNKIISIFLSVILSTAIFVPSFAVNEENRFIKSVAVNKTVPDGYTEITSVDELNAVRDNLDGKYILMNDVDLSSVTNWTPIGNKDVPFTGVFNGNGYSVKNLSVTEVSNKSVGLFGDINNATVANVYIEKVNIKINNPYQVAYYVGAVAGVINSSNVLNCSASGCVDVTAGGTLCIGGIAGYVSEGNSTIMNCLNTANIQAAGALSDDGFGLGSVIYAHVGGMAGIVYNGNTISRCMNKGNIGVTPLNYVYSGGICGSALYNAPITDCANNGEISVNGMATVGGICGQSHSIANCYNTGSISVDNESDSKLGGIAGTTQFNMSRAIVSPLPENAVNATVSNCYYIDEYETAISNGTEGDVSSVKALSADEFTNQESFAGFDFVKVWVTPPNEAPILMRKTSELGSYVEVKGTDSFELFGSIVYAVSNNEEIVSVENNSLVKCISSGKTSIDTINADGDFSVIEISVVCENEDEAPKGIFEKISEFFASLVAWFLAIFD